jgi:hypothetical protein
MLLHVATTDLSTVVMVLGSLSDQDEIKIQAVVMPEWERTPTGGVEFANRWAVNAYLVLEIAERARAATWWEEWADYVRTDLKTPFHDDEYAWIDRPQRA